VSVDVAKVLEEHSKVEGGVRCAAPDCGWPYVPTSNLPRLIAEHQAAVLANLSVGDTTDMRRMTMVEIRNRDFPDRMDAARKVLLEGHAEARATAELELLRAGAAAGMEVVDGIYGAGGRRTIRLGELMRYAREFPTGELDDLLKFHHEDRITQRRRALAREQSKSA
jgi:hypothetical protein